ncbi:unnamed protein product [Adineta ricciae]|uniref:Uncharacterized protein n=1 Tax=Adineta ricciae TaxID=249248 RepID=A0A813QZU2_ADIRI|nr:unnamed protein product [Adineta ricciae]CAF1276500.1 unnamed protein product [Adineta ricciae]
MYANRDQTYTQYELPDESYSSRDNFVIRVARNDVSTNVASNVPVKSSGGCIRIPLMIACGIVGCLLAAAVIITLYVVIYDSINGSKTTTTTSTTTTTLLTLITGVQNYAVMLNANGYHGIYYIRYYSATNTSTSLRITYPIVYLSGTTFLTTYTNNAWYGLGTNCVSSTGVATCTAVCKSLSRSYVGVTSTCTSGYLGSVTSYVTPDYAVYTTSDSTSTPWTDYGTALNCASAMSYCDCSL